MALQKILSSMRQAVEKFDMIAEGDRICVGLSGGKDSLVLLAALAAYRRFSPQKFVLGAVTVDMGLQGTDLSPLKNYCNAENIEYSIVKTEIGPLIFDVRKEKNPCSLCSKMRRGALCGAMSAHGYNKLALGHHADDLAETMLLSLLYEGRFSTFSPVSYMDRSGITLIRPLILTREKDIIPASGSLPVCKNSCPANQFTQREYVKKLLRNICKDIPFAKDRMIGALTHPERNNLWDKNITADHISDLTRHNN